MTQQTKTNQRSTNSSVGKTDVSVRKTLSNTTLCPAMRPFGTLAEAMRIKKINYVVIMKGVAHMVLEEPINGKREGVLHVGESVQIRSQDQYEKYKDFLDRHVDPWTFDEIRQRAQEVSQGLFQHSMQQKQQKVAEGIAAEQTVA